MKRLIVETQRRDKMEITHAVRVINKTYNEWKSKKRRKNAIDLITTSMNSIVIFDPSIIPQLHYAAKLKLVTILMRCMDNPMWKPIATKEKIYKRLYHLISSLQEESPLTPTGASLGEIIMTRLAAGLSRDLDREVCVSYEPVMPEKYLQYLFGDDIPSKVYKMKATELPEEFSELVEILTNDLERATKHYEKTHGN